MTRIFAWGSGVGPEASHSRDLLPGLLVFLAQPLGGPPPSGPRAAAPPNSAQHLEYSSGIRLTNGQGYHWTIGSSTITMYASSSKVIFHSWLFPLLFRPAVCLRRQPKQRFDVCVLGTGNAPSTAL